MSIQLSIILELIYIYIFTTSAYTVLQYVLGYKISLFCVLFILSRDILSYVYIPVVQKELDVFRTTVWNHKRGRKQINKQLPTGVPDIIFENPEE